MNLDDLKDAQSETFTIKANTMESFDFTGRFVHCFNSNGRGLISFNYGAKMYIDAGVQRSVPIESDDFTSFQIYNDNDFDLEIEVGFGYGSIKDSRLSVAGIVSVKTSAGNTLSTDDVNTQTALNEILNLLKDDKEKRAELTTLEGATHAYVANATTTIVSSGANTSGIILRIGDLSLAGSGTDAEIRLGSAAIARIESNSSSGAWKQIKDIFIPAGNSLVVYADASADVNVWYEVL